MLKKNNTDYVVTVFLLTLLAYITLYLSRSLDNNSLTSWQWTFIDFSFIKVFIALIPGVLLALILTKVSSLEKHPVFFLFSSSYVLAIFFWKEPEAIIDVSRYFTQAKYLEVFGIKYFVQEWGKGITAWTDLPLVPFIYGIIFKFFGEARVYIQIFTTLFFSMTVVLTYLIGKRLWDKNTGFSGGLLLLGIPYLFTQVPLMLVDVPAMFFLTLSIFTFIRVMDKGTWDAIMCSSAAICLAFFTKYSTWLMLSVLIIVVLVYMKIPPSQTTSETNPPIPPLVKGGKGGLTGQGRTVFYRGSITILIACVLIGVFFLYKFDVFSGQIKLLLNYQKPGLARWSESFVSTFFFQTHPFITVAALFSIYSAFKKRDLKYIIIFWLVALIFLFQIKRIRYTIVIFPMLSLMASYGIMQIKNKQAVKFISFFIVISSLVVAIALYLPFIQKMSTVNLKEAGRFIDSIDVESVEVFTLLPKHLEINPAVAVPILDLFTEKNIIYKYNNTDFQQPMDKIEKSSLRFTWEYENPPYYSQYNISKEKTAIVLISDYVYTALPKNVEDIVKDYKLFKIFETYDGIFRYRTFVRIYLPKSVLDKNEY